MTNTATETAPTVLWSKPEAERKGTPLLVLLHGYGSNEADLFGLVEMLPEEFTIASVRAGEQAGPGFAWFPLRADVSYSLDTVKTATEETAAWIDTVKGDHSSVSLLGFSQGMCMATSLARHRPSDYAAVVGLSGFVVDADGDPFFQDEVLAEAKIPVFWGRDQADPVIPEAAVEYTNTWLRGHSKITKVLYTGIWHGINAQEMAHVKEFLAMTVPAAK
ncbi:alpha/beta hydrolase [Arthrobacter sp. 35W]|uniref:alpha/beta hydrolase n=1 Tax=Arthrobacter sp. 35W TaxID=1132441 RepID=UPI000423DB1E|nr:alpha/beta hydrolase-fold protein [Arthrobacter sp. 35W]